ncbi:MAG: tetratricopeptide repeat protein, partial [Acidobacteriota bacterium]
MQDRSRAKTARTILLSGALFLSLIAAVVAQGLPPQAVAEFQQAVRFFEQGRYSQALELLTALEKAHADSFDVQQLLAIALDLAGKPAEANRHFRQAVALRPRSVQARANLGTSYVRIGKTEEAIAEFRKALELDPGNATANFNLGTILLRQRKPKEALPWLEKAVAAQPRVYENGYHLALACHALGNHRRAQEVLDSLMPVPRERAEFYLLLALNRRSLGETDQAQQALSEVLPLLTAHPEAHEEVAMLLFEAGLFQEAIPVLQEAARRFPGSAAVLLNLARAELQTGRHDAALDHAKAALSFGETSDAHLLAADILEASGKPLEALSHFQAAVRLEPSESNFVALGYEFLSHWNWKEAESIFAFALERFPDSWRLRVGLGAAFLGQNEHEKATQLFLQSIDIRPDDPLGYRLLVQSFPEASESFEKAVRRFDEFHAANPDNPWAAYYRTLASWRSGLRGLPAMPEEKSVGLLRGAVREKPDLVEAHFLLGEIHFGAKRWQEAISAYELAVRHDPDHMEAHYKLGLSLQ